MKRLFCLFSLFFFSQYSSAVTSVWRVDSATTRVYFAGTCHMLRASDWPLPSAFDRAYSQADVLAFETDLKAMEDTQFQMALLQRVQLPAGLSLKTLLSDGVYQRLANHCRSIQLPIEALHGLKPSFAMITLALMEYQKLGVTQEGVDQYYLNRAIADGKSLRFLESVDDQIDVICSLGDGDEDAFVDYSLREMQSAPEAIHQILAFWRSGDVAGLNALINVEMRSTSPMIYQRMLLERNANWMPAILDYFATDVVEYVLVGAAHLVGEDGLLKQLEQKGYKVTQLPSQP